MCLILREKDGDKPYNTSTERWKTVLVNDKGEITSRWVYTEKWTIGEWKRGVMVPGWRKTVFEEWVTDANGNGHGESVLDHDHGIHVYLAESDARYSCAFTRRDVAPFIRLAKVEVREFLASGVTEWISGFATETWKEARIIELKELPCA